MEARTLLELLAESWTAADRKVARASSERSLASAAGSDARKRLPGGALRGGGEVEKGDDGDEGEQLPSSLHSQHAASLLCGEGVLAATVVIVIFERSEGCLHRGRGEARARKAWARR